MRSITYEDRTQDTQELALERRVVAAGKFLIQAAISVSGSSPALGLNALAMALGQGSRRTGANLEEVLAAVRYYFETPSTDLPAPEVPEGQGQA